MLLRKQNGKTESDIADTRNCNFNKYILLNLHHVGFQTLLFGEILVRKSGTKPFDFFVNTQFAK